MLLQCTCMRAVVVGVFERGPATAGDAGKVEWKEAIGQAGNGCQDGAEGEQVF